MTRFERDTAVVARGVGRYEGRLDRGWWISAGPNGGYLAAIALRGLLAAQGADARAPRSLSVHYLERPREGAIELQTRLERKGRSLSVVSARLLQDDKTVALARGAFSLPRTGFEFDDALMPELPPPESLAPREESADAPPLRARFESRPALGDPPASGAAEAVIGGWIRPTEPQRADPVLLAALSDSWAPAAFSKPRPEDGARGAPTIDLTVHFRSPLEPADREPGAFFLCVFRSRLAREGFVEEDGEIWSREGRLLAQSRQLAIFA